MRGGGGGGEFRVKFGNSTTLILMRVRHWHHNGLPLIYTLDFYCLKLN